jgi:Fe-S cluster biogenesis protein NfuA
MTDLRDKTEAILRGDVAREMNLIGEGIDVLDVTDGVARVRITGACASCPSSLMVVIQAMEQELKKHLPEIDYIEPVV